MNTTQDDHPSVPASLRLWPGVAAVVLWLLRFGVPLAVPATLPYGIIGGGLLAVAVLLWWAFLGRAPRAERWGGVALIVAAVALTPFLLHPSVRTGMMGAMFYLYAIPAASIALLVWVVFSRRMPDVPRRAAMVGAILLSCGMWTILRTDGMTGEGSAEFAWRWSKTHEERLLAEARVQPATVPAASVAAPAAAPEVKEEPTAVPAGAAAVPLTPKAAVSPGAIWPGFRGPARDSVVGGLQIKTDWATSPPVELWRRPVGPAWSSFAVRGDLIYTQEQRGEDELVTCYHAATGKPVWTHRDAARFWESNAGAGPRATPTLDGDRLYTYGATGIVNALNAETGAVLWSHNAASETGKKVPEWGFASSPLVVGDLVIVAAGRLVAFDAATGARRWIGPASGGGYSSPHRATVGGIPQVLLLNGSGVIGVDPKDGSLLWKHDWPGDGIVQPTLTSDGDILIGTGSGMGSTNGVRRIAVSHGPSGWTTEERWTSAGLKPYFNDIVVHDGHAYGFDGSILACIDLQDGKRKWKGGRYGHGQLLLLRDQGLLLVLSETGELALVKAAPDQHTEVARIPAIEGKTWNHPVVSGDRVLVRNDSEMAAFRIVLDRR